MDHTFEVTMSRREKYQFNVDLGDDQPTMLLMDEPKPLGDGLGPSAARVMAAAIGNCLSASLLFCLSRAHIDVGDVETSITGTIVRNERGRLRLSSLKVRITPDVGTVPPENIQRCLDIFEDFCVVTASVRAGLDVEVEVVTAAETEG